VVRPAKSSQVGLLVWSVLTEHSAGTWPSALEIAACTNRYFFFWRNTQRGCVKTESNRPVFAVSKPLRDPAIQHL
jgi:hypothetical protein